MSALNNVYWGRRTCGELPSDDNPATSDVGLNTFTELASTDKTACDGSRRKTLNHISESNHGTMRSVFAGLGHCSRQNPETLDPHPLNVPLTSTLRHRGDGT